MALGMRVMSVMRLRIPGRTPRSKQLNDRASLRLRGNPASLDNTVEEKLKRPVRLSAEQDLRPKHRQPAFADFGVNDGHASIQIFLAPGPATAQRGLGVAH